MQPQEFLDKWKLTRPELASLLGKSLNTVDHYFSSGKSRMNPTVDVLARLDEIDALFTCWQVEDDRIPHLRTLYDIVRERLPD